VHDDIAGADFLSDFHIQRVKVCRASGGESSLSLEENQRCAAKPAILMGF
jgi:hypothetical protein